MSTSVKWSLKGDYLDACSCDAGCPCRFGANPTQGHCHGVAGFDITEGSYGDVDLTGLGLCLMIKAPGAPWEGNITGTIYVDESANSEQRQALETILSGQAGGFFAVLSSLISDNRGVKFAPTRMENDGDRRTFTIPGVVELVNEPLVNPITKQVQDVTVTNSFVPYAVSGRAGTCPKAISKDADVSVDVSGYQGYIGQFAWAGP